MKRESENVVLICNPRAGGRWKQLAGILDSAEAQQVRRIVTDSIEDIGPALADLGQRVKLVIIYGGDGTIQQILSEIYRAGTTPVREASLVTPIALVGGGTMNLTARWCGFTRSPEKNFRRVVQDFLTDKLVTREVPLLAIRQGERVEYGFVFGAGTAIRILNEYEQGQKGKVAALGFAARAIVAAWSKLPTLACSIEQMRAEIVADGERLPYDRFFNTFCTITGTVAIGVSPFATERQRETFHMLAYAADPREVAVLLPFLARGMIPIDPRSLLQPVSAWKQVGLTYLGKGSLPLDPRYVSRCVREYEIRTDEQVFTIDGEIFTSTGEPIFVGLGPTMRLAIAA